MVGGALGRPAAELPAGPAQAGRGFSKEQRLGAGPGRREGRAAGASSMASGRPNLTHCRGGPLGWGVPR